MPLSTTLKPDAKALTGLAYAQRAAESDLVKTNQLILNLVSKEAPLIAGIGAHLINSGGKRIRPLLTLLAARSCGYKGDAHIPLAAAVEFLHTATLLHDDVVDESRLRRGRETANEVWGNKASVLVGDFLLAQAFQLMTGSGSIRVLETLSNAAAIISRGEVLQLAQEGEINLPVEIHLEIITAKTAALFEAACVVGVIIAGESKYEPFLREFGLNIGIAFQLIDDALDYSADETHLGKTIGDDFREGKATLPVLLAFAEGNAEEKNFWRRTIGDRNQQEDDLKQALKLLKKTGSIRRALTLAEEYCEKASAALNNLPASESRRALEEIVAFCRNRSY